MLQLADRGADRVSPFAIVQTLPNLAAGWVSIELGTRGPLLTQSTACAASNMAIGDGLDAIRLGRADVMVCGGTEAPITATAVAGFAAMRALSTRDDDPGAASRPFDGERDGFVMAEAAAVLVLEELEHALARNARIYAEISGYGVSSDANHVSDPDPIGTNAGRAVQMALADADLRPEDVGYVNAHGTSTPAGDAAETRVLKLVFGDTLGERTHVSSTKGATGHTLGAAGAVEAVFTILALHHGVLPADDQSDRRRPGMRSRLHTERAARRASRRSGARTRSVSAGTTASSPSVAGRGSDRRRARQPGAPAARPRPDGSRVRPPARRRRRSPALR